MKALSTFTALLAATLLASTASAAQSSKVKLKTSLSNQNVLMPGDGKVSIAIDLEAAKATSGKRLPMNVALVIDRSGSMRGDKMAQTLKAAAHFVKQLSDKDTLAIISYSDSVRLDLPAAAITREVKKDALAALEAFGAPVENLMTDTRDIPGWFHPGRSGTLGLGKNVLAVFGELHPKALRVLGIKGRMVGFELFLDKIPPKKGKSGTAKPLLKPSPFQPVKRDFAFIVNMDVSAEKLVKAVRGADKALISGVTLFDVYVGENVPEGKKSLAVDVTLQPTERTLTDEDIEGVSEKIVALVAKNLGGELRG